MSSAAPASDVDRELSQVPPEACRFQVDLEISDANGEQAKTAPFRMRARSGHPIYHPLWGGAVVHDVAGMFLPDSRRRVPVDFNHNPDEVIGYANHFDTSEGHVDVAGAIVPYREQDRAAEVLHKARLGVPWQASINFAGTGIEIETLAEGETATVNGREFAGPMTIVRKWPLLSIAVCENGADQWTATQFSSSPGQFAVPITRSDDMSQKLKLSALEAKAEELATPATEQQPPETETATAVVEAQGDDDKDAEAATPAATPEPAAVEAPETSPRAEEGAKFMASFGEERGAFYFAKGFSFEAAQQEHIKFLTTQVDTLSHKLKAVSSDGEPAALSSSSKPVKKKSLAVADPKF